MAFKLLVVDDDKAITDMLADMLLNSGYDVVVAYDGEEALLKVDKENPDIIILDLLLPKLNGFEVLKKIKENTNNKWMPVIIVSAKNELESVQKCYELEADHYLTKPCPLDRVLKGVETMISLIPVRKKQ